MADDQSDVIDFLAGLGTGDDTRRVDTHCAMIFLSGDRALKLKRAVNLGYLDFSDVAKRHAVCAAELVLNRRTAPDLYRALRPIRRDATGTLTLGGPVDPATPPDPAAIDWVVDMRRFPDSALLASMADRGELTPARLRSLADAVARFHDGAEIAHGHDGVERVRHVIDGNRAAMAAVPQILPPDQCAMLGERWETLLDEHAPLLARRAAQGHVRLCHGDLHLANICLWQGRPTLFDCLEFDTALATTDVLYDLAFLLMDLLVRGLAEGASLVLNRYCDRRPHEQDGLPALGLFLSLRAGIRAHVGALGASRQSDPARAAQQAEAARRYLALALACVAPRTDPPRLVAVGGLSGTGKSTLAGALAPHLGPMPGARWLRSDVIRKRLAGIDPETPLPPASYTPEATRRTYGTMMAEAQALLRLGQSVVVDAVFGSRVERAGAAEAAQGAGAPFSGLWLEAPDAVLIARATQRSARRAAGESDASDADADVVRRQIAHPPPPPPGWHVLDAGGLSADILARAKALLARNEEH